jgi:hypothetical protein
MKFSAFGLLLLLLTGCAYKIRIPAYPLGTPLTVARFVAGAGKSDITPAPGIPMGGHGPAGRVSRGYWTRLYARAIYFQDSRNRGLALVSCELFSLPAGLRAKVLQLVNQNFRLEPERLILTSDCGMGREGMSRRHAFYKMVALVQGVNLVKQELGLPVTPSQAADPKFSLIRTA